MSVTKLDADDNKKLVPNSPIIRLQPSPEEQDDDGIYPNISGYSTVLGEHFYTHQNPQNPDAYGEEKLNADGSYRTAEYSSKKKGIVSELNHHTRGYNSGGHSQHVDGHSDHNTESTSNKNVAGDSSSATGKTKYAGSQKTVEGTKDGRFYHSTACVDYNTSKGDIVSEHTGDKHSSHEGDEIKSIKGNKHLLLDGEYGVHVQSGNMDTQIDNGKARIKAAKDILIESDQTITLKVGSSQIIITSSDITIKVGNKGIKIDTDVVITAKTYTGQASIDSKEGVAAPPTKFE